MLEILESIKLLETLEITEILESLQVLEALEMRTECWGSKPRSAKPSLGGIASPACQAAQLSKVATQSAFEIPCLCRPWSPWPFPFQSLVRQAAPP